MSPCIYCGAPADSREHWLPRCLGAKVGFHYFLSTSRRCTGAEPEFAPLRQFIRHGEGEWPSFVQLNAPQFIPELANGLVPRQTSHFFYVEQDVQAVAWVQFFVGPDDLPPPTIIRLGNSPSHVQGRFAVMSSRHVLR